MKEKSELLEQLLNDFTRSDLLSMQETGEYLEELLNVFVHDFAMNLLFMEETMVSIPVLNFTSILPDQNVCGITHHAICSGYSQTV